MGNSLNNFTQNLASNNLGVKPWSTVEQQNLSAGDIVLFSSRSYVGRTNRFYQGSVLFTHVGIVLKVPFDSRPYIMECSVVRESLYSGKVNGTIVLTSTVQPLRNKVYSGLYDMIAVRKINWKINDSQKNVFFGKNLNVFGSDSEAQRSSFVSSRKKFRENYAKFNDELALRLLDISQMRFEFCISKNKFNRYVQKAFFDSKYIFGAPDEEIAGIIGAEYVAEVFSRVHIFDHRNHKVKFVIPKFKAMHFCTDSKFILPFDNRVIKSLSKQYYIYLDYQVYMEDLVVREALKPPSNPPKGDKSLTFNYFRNHEQLDSLKTGDLIFFQEEGPLADTFREVTGCAFTNIGMVVRFPGVRKVFLFQSPPYFVTDYEGGNDADVKKNKKLLESTIISLSSVLQSGYYSRVVVRRLTKDRGVDDHSKNECHIEREGKSIPISYSLVVNGINDIHNLRMTDIFKKMGSFGPEIRFNVSCIFSGEFVAAAYKQMGLLRISDDELYQCTPKYFSRELNLQKDYKLGKETTIDPIIPESRNTISESNSEKSITGRGKSKSKGEYTPSSINQGVVLIPLAGSEESTKNDVLPDNNIVKPSKEQQQGSGTNEAVNLVVHSNNDSDNDDDDDEEGEIIIIEPEED